MNSPQALNAPTAIEGKVHLLVTESGKQYVTSYYATEGDLGSVFTQAQIDKLAAGERVTLGAVEYMDMVAAARTSREISLQMGR